MGEMCDFEAEFFPQAWNQTTKKRRAGKREVKAVLTKAQYAEYKALGGAAWLKRTLTKPPMAMACEPSPNPADTTDWIWTDRGAMTLVQYANYCKLRRTAASQPSGGE